MISNHFYNGNLSNLWKETQLDLYRKLSVITVFVKYLCSENMNIVNINIAVAN